MTKPAHFSSLRGLFYLLLFLCMAPSVLAHKSSDSYLRMQRDANGFLVGQWDIAIRDLDLAVGLDVDENAEVTWAELTSRRPALESHALEHLAIATPAGPSIPYRFTDLLVNDHSDGSYAVLFFKSERAIAEAGLKLTYSFLFEMDPQHRGLVQFADGEKVAVGVATPERRTINLAFSGEAARHAFATFFKEGVWHIWIGFDHILFLLALLLPAVFIHKDGGWQSRPDFWGAFREVIKLVTAFTIAHSITLTMVTLGWIHMNGRFVESVIAASVVIAALNNVYRFFKGSGWLIAFGFGLIHGFGFASVLEELGLAGASLGTILLGFNLGIEIGQLAIVAIFFPISYSLRHFPSYRVFSLRYASFGIAAVAAVWMFERILSVKLLPF